MIWREVKENDLAACLAIDPRSRGDFVVGQQGAVKIWQNLLRNPAFNCALVETNTKSAPRAIVSFGASVFVKSKYADRQLHDPKPDLTSRIFADISHDEPVLRSEDSLVGPKAKDGLDLVLLSSSFSLSDLTSEQQVEVGILLPQTLVQLHVGYRIRRILMETTNERMRLLAIASGLWRIVASFQGQERALFVVTQKESLHSAGFDLLSPLFHHRTPVLRLRNTEKQLLCQAVHGETDAELAACLNLSVSSVKKRWVSLFARIADVQPDLLPEEDDFSKRENRGAQKRHRILAYVREHPEELRPFRWYPWPIATAAKRPSPPST